MQTVSPILPAPHTDRLHSLDHGDADADGSSTYSDVDGSLCLSSHSESSQPSSQDREEADVRVEAEGDTLYHELRAKLRPAQPAAIQATSAPSSSSSALHLQPELWPLLCDVFSQAQRSRSSSPSSSSASASFSFLRLLTAHAELSESAGWSAAVAERLLSFLLQLHRLSRHIARPHVHWWRLLQSAWIHQCRQDAALRADASLRQRMQQDVQEDDSEQPQRQQQQQPQGDYSVREEKAQPSELEQAGSLVRRRWQRDWLSDGQREFARQQVVHSQADGRLHRQQSLVLCFRVWRCIAVSERPSPLLAEEALRLELRLQWRRWQQAWRSSRAERMLAKRCREKLAAAIQRWQRWTQHTSEQRAVLQRLQQAAAAAAKSRCMRAWYAAHLERGEEERRQHIAAQHYQQTALPAALELWMRRTQARRRGRLAEQQADEWRRRVLASASLAAWQARRRTAALYSEEAAARLLPMRVRAALFQWQRRARLLQSACITSPLLLHGLFSWLSVSLSLPVPLLPSSPQPQSVRPCRRLQHQQMQAVWRRWIMTRLWRGWKQRGKELRAERMAAVSAQQASNKQRLQGAWRVWRCEMERKAGWRRQKLRRALLCWQARTEQRRRGQDLRRTALLVHRFHSQRRHLLAWAALHRRLAAERRQQEAEEQRLSSLLLLASSHRDRRLASDSVLRWRAQAVQQRLSGRLLASARSHWVEHGRRRALALWRQWLEERHRRQAAAIERAEQADVRYVGRLLSLTLLCWRLQLHRRLEVRRLRLQREDRAQHQAFSHWQQFVQEQRAERQRAREAEVTARREEDERKGAMLSRLRLYAAWAHWRRLMRVVETGQALRLETERRRQRALLLLWARRAREQETQRRDRRHRLQDLLLRYLQQKREGERQRWLQLAAAERRIRRGRLQAVWSQWTAAAAADLSERRLLSSRHDAAVKRAAWAAWTEQAGALHQLAAAADSQLRRGVFSSWRYALYLRGVFVAWNGVEARAEGGQEAAFLHWRQRLLTAVWRLWRQRRDERLLDLKSEAFRCVTALTAAVRTWKAESGRQRAVRDWLQRRGSQRGRQLLSQWAQTARAEKQERQRLQTLTLRLPSLASCLRCLLLSCLRPSLPSLPVSSFFQRWAAFAASRRRRSLLLSRADGLYQTRILSSVLRSWAAAAVRGQARRRRREEVARGVDGVCARNGFLLWRGVVEQGRSRQRRYIVSHAFCVWKWQVRRLRERRQLLQQVESAEARDRDGS